MTSLIGQSLGRYHILEQLGEGGMAVVYKAFDTRLEAVVAVKVIRTENILPSILERSLKRFEREAKSLARLTHPNIVKVMDYGEYESRPFLVMPYLPGGTLKDRLKQGMLPWREAFRLLFPIAQALAYAHKQNIIHRDVKPSNILLTESGEPMLTDFGVAKLFDMEETQDLTGTSMGVGTPEYMAPEQWQGQVSVQTDVYALGVVLYEMIVGHKPYSADTPAALLLKQAIDPLPRPSSFVPDLPVEVEYILLSALTKDTRGRYENMDAFIVALEKTVANQEGIYMQQSRHNNKSIDSEKTVEQGFDVTSRTPVQLETVEIEEPNTGEKASPSYILQYGAIGLISIGVLFFILMNGRQSSNSGNDGIPTSSSLLSSSTPFLVMPTPSQPIYTPTLSISVVPTYTPWPLSTKVGGGGEIAFASNQDGDYELYIMESDGSNLVQLTGNTQDDFYPSWSNDGTKIVFSSGNYEGASFSGVADIYILDLETEKISRVTDTPNWFEYSPTWSPDGETIAYFYSGGGSFGIRLIDPSGNNQTDFIQHLNFPQELRWSPSGNELLYSSYGLLADGSLESINIIVTSLTGNSKSIINSGFNYFPSWSPQGDNVAFICPDSRGSGICTSDRNGQSIKIIYDYAEWGGTDWSPDGNRIIFTNNLIDGQTDRADLELFTIKTNGTDLIQLTNNSWEDTNPSWYWPK